MRAKRKKFHYQLWSVRQ